MNFWLNLKEKLASFLKRDKSLPRFIAGRSRIARVLFFLDKNFYRVAFLSTLFLILLSILYIFYWQPPYSFPNQALITIEKGESLTQVANSFEEQRIIRSSFWLKVFIVLMGGQRKVVAGDYYFPEPANTFKVASMVHNGKFGLIAQRITIFEGTNSFEIAKILEKELPAFEARDFVSEVLDNNYEGYLFPDTYFLTPNTKAGDVITMMRENFVRQIKPYEEDILKSKRPLGDIVTMASIIEEEANGTLESKRIVSGILWKRLRLKMPLQVDAPFVYYNGKNSYTLTKNDLSEDHEYNTYVNKGLPPTAIASPGIDSLRAAIAPTNTDYLYFLSDKKGNMYYAKTFEQHKRNRELYLN